MQKGSFFPFPFGGSQSRQAVEVHAAGKKFVWTLKNVEEV